MKPVITYMALALFAGGLLVNSSTAPQSMNTNQIHPGESIVASSTQGLPRAIPLDLGSWCRDKKIRACRH